MKMNKKILASMVVIGILALAMGYGTYSYFSDQAKSTGNTFTAGTLDIKLWGSSWQNDVVGTWVSPTNWAPGESVEATLYMKNFGSIGVTHIGVKVDNLGGTGLESAVLLTKFVYTEYWDYTNNKPGTTRQEYDITGWVISLIDGADGSTPDGKGTLKEFIYWCAVPHSLKFFEGSWESGEPYLKPNGANEQYLILGFTFDPDAGNEYQGKTASFDLSVIAAQSYSQWPPVWWTTPSHGY
jgi:predicted ribosomally synthesized peptide with SipW-like signal peptide